jgi:putative ABC transport system permease protein
VVGLAAGLALAVVSVRGLGTLLYGVPPSDPTTFVVATLTLGSSAVLACLIPAWRASRIDPVRALRSE